ncbi:MAG: insulinase family protein [Bacteroidetes bacterium]|nr:insulinase family protein [Bacteroidota bacterium]
MFQSSETLERSRQPEIRQAAMPRFPDYPLVNMNCGARAVILNDPEADGVRLEFVLPAGSSREAQPLAAQFTIALLREGTQAHPGTRLIKKLDRHGAFVELQASADYAWLTAYAHKRNVASILPLLGEMLTSPELKEKPFQLYRKRQLTRFRTEMLRTRTLASRSFRKLLYADSCYSNVPEESDYLTLKPDDIREFYHTRYGARGMWVIAAGNIGEQWLHTLDNQLAGFVGQGPDFVLTPPGTNAATGQHYVQKADALQSSIVMGRLVVDRRHPDFAALSLTNTILGGYFGSRLMSNLREDKGYTYGIYSQIQSQELATQLTISADVGAEVTAQALDQIRFELRRLQHEAVPDQELELVKNYLSGSYAQALDGVFNQALRLRGLLPVGLGLNYYENLMHEIQQTDAAKVMEIARKYLDPDQMLCVVAGNQAVDN